MKNLYAFVKAEVERLDESETTSFINSSYYEELLVENHGYTKSAAKEVAFVCKVERQAEIDELIEEKLEDLSDLILERNPASGWPVGYAPDEQENYVDAARIVKCASIETTLIDFVAAQID